MASLPEEALRWTVIELKQSALRFKKEGDVPQALQLLRQAKGLEAVDAGKMAMAAVEAVMTNNPTLSSSSPPPMASTMNLPPEFWKRLAILYQQNGDLEKGKAALLQAKVVEASATSAAASVSASAASANTPTKEAVAVTKETPSQEEGSFRRPPMSSSSSGTAPTTSRQGTELHQQNIDAGKEDDANSEADIDIDDDDNDDDVDVDGLLSDGDDDGEGCDVDDGVVTFSDVEMVDQTMMIEFCSEGMPVPSHDDYSVKIVEYKKQALRYKQDGDIPKATQSLRFAKQLEQVQTALLPHRTKINNNNNNNNDDGGAVGVDPEQWINSLNEEESELLGELFRNDTSGPSDDGLEDFGDPKTGAASAPLTCDEIEGMDVDDLVDFVEMMGRQALPTDLEQRAIQQQQQAVVAKQQGDIASAKARLVESKRLKLQAQKVATVMGRLDRTGLSSGPPPDEVSIDALEALVSGGTKKKLAIPPSTASKLVEPPEDPWLSRPSADIKQEIVRLKNDRQVKEATRLLQVFKVALQREQRIAEEQRCAVLITKLQERLDDCTVQIRLWQYYQWFVDDNNHHPRDGTGTADTALGERQYELWNKFAHQCRQSILAIQSGGSAAVVLTPLSPKTEVNDREQLYTLQDEMMDIVERGMTSTTTTPSQRLGGDLEIAVLGVFGMNENEKLQKILRQKQRERGRGNKGGVNGNSDTGGTATPAPNDGYCPLLRVEAKVQLPLNPDDPSQPTLLEYMPIKSQTTATSMTLSSSTPSTTYDYTFDPRNTKHSRHRLKVARGDSKHAKTLLKRFDTKTVQFSVYETHQRPLEVSSGSNNTSTKSKSSSWFFGGGGTGRQSATSTAAGANDDGIVDGDEKDNILGKVTVELRPLLTRNCIVGDYPLMVNGKAVGGTIRICLRTDIPMNEELYVGCTEADTIISTSKYGRGVLFTFRKNGTASVGDGPSSGEEPRGTP